MSPLVGARRALLSRPAVVAGGPVTYATWNPSDKHASVTLSGGNLVAAGSATANVNGCVRSTVGKSSGKWYWEVAVTTAGTVSQSHGIADAAEDLDAGASLVNLDGFRVYQGSLGAKFKPNTAYGATYTAGDVLGFALDMDAGTLVCYKNNASQGTLVSSLSGTFYAYAVLSSPSSGTAPVATANFGPTLTYTPPVGFNAGLYA